MRVGAIIAEGAQDIDRFCRFGWYFGAAFQIQDDVLNLTADYAKYGKEIGGDLYEGKRTLMPIRLLSRSRPAQRRALERFLMKSRAERTSADVEWVHGLMLEGGAIEYARRKARQLAAGVRACGRPRGARDVPGGCRIPSTSSSSWRWSYSW
jgi:geranylgeranyl diphosphate synthase type II